MKKHTLPRKILTNSAPVFLVLCLAACEDSATGLTASDLCGFSNSCGGGGLVGPVPDYRLLVFTATPLPNAALTVAYSQSVEHGPCSKCSGGYTWSVTNGSLPPGLSLSADGLITGTPTEVGTFDFKLRVVSGDGQQATKVLSIMVGLLQVLQPSELCSDYYDAAIATFEDANLESAIRSALGVGAEVDLTCGLISGVTDLV